MKKYLIVISGIMLLVILFGCGTSGSVDEDDQTQADSLPADQDKQKNEGDGLALLKKLAYDVTSEKTDNQITFQMELTNPTDEQVKISFPSGQQYEVIVKSKKSDEVVYRYSEGRMFTQAIVDDEIEPGETKTWEQSWEFKEAEPGDYTATVMLLPEPVHQPSNENNPFVKKVSFSINGKK
ncbi:hypothetical protein GWK91_01220 [Virgibacillus sp. MSP4-1]|uniref:BsuPI-related putative proteinase inhibitor n=1 Tax=Virgibacillus sp. MSP4-1 TaxID=2700081 RepID=UPI00039A74BE|nr:BsuPI-related putative proteinase inhibitor [Virgibacillus sp. MSP4-1]QHS21655.1 hypothetical protein GWK91_01220 [Virgibacillus sp. MSP4-1]